MIRRAQNVGNLMEDFGLHDDVELVYVTRSYATRHGAGPFPGEDEAMSFKDETNKPNDYQGAMRFGVLNVDNLRLEIGRDMDKIRVPFSPSIAVTCLDQRAPNFKTGELDCYASNEEFCREILADRMNFSTAYASLGPKTDSEMKAWSRKGEPCGCKT